MKYKGKPVKICTDCQFCVKTGSKNGSNKKYYCSYELKNEIGDLLDNVDIVTGDAILADCFEMRQFSPMGLQRGTTGDKCGINGKWWKKAN